MLLCVFFNYRGNWKPEIHHALQRFWPTLGAPGLFWATFATGKHNAQAGRSYSPFFESSITINILMLMLLPGALGAAILCAALGSSGPLTKLDELMRDLAYATLGFSELPRQLEILTPMLFWAVLDYSTLGSPSGSTLR